MRLTCPNCGAQYEVPDEVIPTEGRDVQCSNCGDTWFQTHASAAAGSPQAEPQPPEAEWAEPEDMPEHASGDTPADTPDAVQADAAHDGDDPALYDDSDEVEDDGDDQDSDEQASSQRSLDPSVSDILRQEAEREAALRAREAENLESQPDLGLDDAAPDEPKRRAREARDRMARIRGEEASVETPDATSRRELLPDIEEINSTLRSSADAGTPAPTPAQAGPAKRRRSGGFIRGLAVMLLFGVILALLYTNAAGVARTVPQADPMLSAYVALVDQARLWLDAQVGGLIPKP